MKVKRVKKLTRRVVGYNVEDDAGFNTLVTMVWANQLSCHFHGAGPCDHISAVALKLAK